MLEGLLEFFFHKELFDYQTAASGLLWKLKPKYRRNLREDIRRSLPNWNVSVKELPWYLAEMTGIETVRGEIKALMAEPLDKMEWRKADTYLYWLAGNAERIRKELNDGWNGRLRG